MINEEVILLDEFKQSKKELWFDSLVVEKNIGWVFANDFNGLFEIDLQTYNSRYLGSLPQYSITQASLCFCMEKVKDDILILPWESREIYIFNLNSKEFTKAEMPYPGYRFCGATVSGEKVYMICNNSPKIVVFDMYNNNFYCLDEIEEHKFKRNRIPDRVPFRKGICSVGEYIYCVSCDDSEVYRIKAADDAIEYYELSCADNGLRNIAFDGEYFWISEWDKASIIRWKPESNQFQKYECPEYTGIVYRSADIVCMDRKVYMFPTGGDDRDDVICFNKESREWEVPSQFKEYGSKAKMNKSCWNHIYTVAQKYGDDIFAFSGKTNELIRYNKCSEIREGVLFVHLNKAELSELVNGLVNNRILFESECEIDDYLKLITLG